MAIAEAIAECMAMACIFGILAIQSYRITEIKTRQLICEEEFEELVNAYDNKLIDLTNDIQKIKRDLENDD